MNNLRKSKSSRKPQLNIPGLQSTKGLTWFRDGDVVINHIWPDVDRRKGIKVNAKPTIKPRLNTNAPKYNQTEEYDEDSAVKKIKATLEKQAKWQKHIEEEHRSDANNNADPEPRRA